MVHKYDKIFTKNKIDIPEGLPVYVEEKLDGANFRVWFDGNTLVFGSRTTEFSLDTEDYGQFSNAVDYVRNLNWTQELVAKYYNHIFYFEAMHKHTINYDWVNTPKAILFDIYNEEKDIYATRNEIEEVAKLLNCTTPKLVFRGNMKQFTQADIPKSEYYIGLAEGIVIKPDIAPGEVTMRDVHGNIIRQKIVRDEFKEENSIVFRGTKSESLMSASEVFVNKYLNNVRFNKVLQKLESVKPLPKESLFKAVSSSILFDIVSENIKEIMRLRKVDFDIMSRVCDAKTRLYLQQLGRL